MSVLSDVFPQAVCDEIIKLFELQSRGRDHFEDTFRIIAEEGWPKRCAFGEVYKVRCMEDGMFYAIKKVVIDEEASSRFPDICLFLHACQEAVILEGMSLKHQNIVRSHPHLNWVVPPEKLDAFEMLDVMEHGGDAPISSLANLLGTEFYTVFDWYPDDLHQLLERGHQAVVQRTARDVAIPSKDDVKKILLHILLALLRLHSSGYIHNDVKPNNILIKHYREEELQLTAVLNDFGLSQSINTRKSLSSHRKRRHRYDAPDREFSINVDIWAFGILSFHLTYVYSNRARVSNNEFEILNSLALGGNSTGLRKFLRDMLPRVDRFFVEAVVQCLHLSPERRLPGRVMCHILIDETLFKQACRVATEFHSMLRYTGNEVLEILIFPDWYKNVFLPKIQSSPLSPEIVLMFTSFLDEYDFPLVAVFNRCDRAMRAHLADLVNGEHHSLPSDFLPRTISDS